MAMPTFARVGSGALLLALTGCASTETAIDLQRPNVIEVTFGETQVGDLFAADQILFHIDPEAMTIYVDPEDEGATREGLGVEEFGEDVWLLSFGDFQGEFAVRTSAGSEGLAVRQGSASGLKDYDCVSIKKGTCIGVVGKPNKSFRITNAETMCVEKKGKTCYTFWANIPVTTYNNGNCTPPGAAVMRNTALCIKQ